MKRRRWPNETKEKARSLRRDGRSYTEITREIGVVKSTLNQWLRDLPKPLEYQYITGNDWLKKIRPLALAANKKKKADIFDDMILKIKEEVSLVKINKDLDKTILSMLYWAEGSKGNQAVLSLANTDPKLVLLFITLLRRSFPVNEEKFRVRLYLHSYHQESQVKVFWSKLLGIPISQFGKTYRKLRSKERTFRRNFGGICFLKYNSVYLQREIIQYAFALGEKITGKVSIPVFP